MTTETDAPASDGQKNLPLIACLVAGMTIGGTAHLLFAGTARSSDMACPTLDVASLNKMVAESSAAASSGKAARLVSLYAADAAVIGTSPGEWLKGHSQLMPAIYDMMKLQPHFVFTPKDQGISCTSAWSAGDAVMDWKDAKSGQKITANYRYTLVYRHENNVWKITHMHLSAPEKR